MIPAVAQLPLDWGRTCAPASGVIGALATLVDRLDSSIPATTRVVRWGTPIPSFGDLARSKVATLGLNPSNREFLDSAGRELQGPARRLPTLTSLGLASWADSDASHLRTILDSCRAYFHGRPYDTWFRRLDYVLSGTAASFYDISHSACHLDLIPYATTCKWAELTPVERSHLLEVTGDTLGRLVQASDLRLVVLNGMSVVEHFEHVADVKLERQDMRSWSLPRNSRRPIAGVSFYGVVDRLSGVHLGRGVVVLGFNHNIQSSYGVSRPVLVAIRDWIGRAAKELID